MTVHTSADGFAHSLHSCHSALRSPCNEVGDAEQHPNTCSQTALFAYACMTPCTAVCLLACLLAARLP